MTHPVAGSMILFLLLLLVIWLTVVGANYPSSLLQKGLDWCYEELCALGRQISLPWWIQGPLLDGVFLTAARVISVMLPLWQSSSPCLRYWRILATCQEPHFCWIEAYPGAAAAASRL